MKRLCCVIAWMLGVVGADVQAQGVVGDWFEGTVTTATNFFAGRVAVGTNGAPTNSAEKLYVYGDARVTGALRVPRQGDVSMGSYTNGDAYAGASGGSGSGSGFTNKVGSSSYTNVGINLQAGSNMAIRLSNGTNFLDSTVVIPAPVAFHVTKGGVSQSVTQSTWTKVTFSNEVLDTSGIYEPTNGTVTIVEAGKYLMTVTMASSLLGADTIMSIYRNGTNQFTICTPRTYGSGTPVKTGTLITPVMDVVSGETFTAYFYSHVVGSSYIVGSPTNTYWSGWKIN